MNEIIMDWNIDIENIINKTNKLIERSTENKKKLNKLSDIDFLETISDDLYECNTFCSMCIFLKNIGVNNACDDIDLLNKTFDNSYNQVKDFMYKSQMNKYIYERLQKIKITNEIDDNTFKKIKYKKIKNIFSKNYNNTDLTTKLRKLINNEENIVKLMQYKHAYAKLYGYKNYAKFIMHDNMINSKSKLINIVKSLLNSTDELYNQIEHKIYNVDVEKYFNLKHIINATIELLSNVLCIELKKINNENIWNKDVMQYYVISNNNKIGILYLDLFKRKNKTNNNSCICITTNELYTSKLKKQIVSQMIICMNINKNEQFMKIDELLSFYHELGHALHTMFGNGLLSGIHAENDFVEIPGYIMELFCLDKLKFLSNGKLPEKLEQTILKNYKHNECINIREQCLMTLYDQYMHSYDTFKKMCSSLIENINDENNKLNSNDDEFQYSVLKSLCHEMYMSILNVKTKNNEENLENMMKYINIKNDVTQHNFLIGKICAHNVYSQYKNKFPLLKNKLFEIGGKMKGLDILKQLISFDPFSIEKMCEYLDFDVCDNKFSFIKDNSSNNFILPTFTETETEL